MSDGADCRCWCYEGASHHSGPAPCDVSLPRLCARSALLRPLPYLSRTEHNDSPTSHTRDLLNVYNNLANFVNRQRL